MIHTMKLGLMGAVCFWCIGMGMAGAEGRTIEIHAHRYAFTPAEITVKKGETVHLKLYSDDVPHSLLIKDLGVNQPIIKGRPAEVTITPHAAGNFHGQCGHFCGSGHGKMTFDVHVTGN